MKKAVHRRRRGLGLSLIALPSLSALKNIYPSIYFWWLQKLDLNFRILPEDQQSAICQLSLIFPNLWKLTTGSCYQRAISSDG